MGLFEFLCASLRPFAVKFLCKDRVIEGADPAKSASFFFEPLKMYETEKVDCGSLGARSFQPFFVSLR
jgi:hypothetical protein